MTSPNNLQKLIVGFLIVATLTGSGVFAFSLYNGAHSSGKSETGTAGVPKSVFVENLPTSPDDPDFAAALAAMNAANATNEIASQLAQSIIAKNPDGPLDRNGSLSIVLPGNATSVIEKYMLEHQPNANILTPRFDRSKVKLVGDSPEAMARYLSQVSSISADLIAKYSPSADDPEAAFTNTQLQLEDSIRQLAKLQVPQTAADYHAAVVELLFVPESYSQILVNDPFSGAALEDPFEQALAQKMVALDKAGGKLKESAMLPPGTRPTLAAEIFGVQTAYATVPTIDYVAIGQAIKMFLLELKKEWKEIVVGYLKNRLMRELTRQIVKWALGEGTPQFVTNWQGFLSDAAQQGAGEVIESIAPGLCGSAGDIGALTGLGNVAEFIRQIMTPVDTYDYSAHTTCTLDKVVSNVKDFAADIRNGGWLSYSAVLQPKNTLLGSIIIVSDAQARKSAETQSAAASKADSGQGYTGTETCDDGKAPKVIAKTKQYTSLNGGASSTQTGPPLLQCEDGSTPHTTTPGANASALVSKSFDSAYDRIVAANDWKGLASFLIDAAVSKGIQAGVKGLLQYKYSRDAGSYGGGVPPGSGGTPGYGEGAGGPTEPSEDPGELAKQILELKQIALSEMRDMMDSLTEAINALQMVAATCTDNQAIVDQARLAVPALVTVQDALSLAIENLAKEVDNFDLTKTYTKTDFDTARALADDYYTKSRNASDSYMNAQNLLASCSSDLPVTLPPPDTSTSSTSTFPGDGGE